MGNHTSRVLDKSKDGKRLLLKKKRRTSTASTFATLQHSQLLQSDLDTRNDKQAGSGAGAIQPGIDPTSGRRKSITNLTNIFTRRKSTVSQSLSLGETREHDRFQRLHYIMKSEREGNIKAKLDSPAFIVDVGTGNGIWAIEVANEYPDAQVLGVDKQRLPQDRLPKNLQFAEFDIMKDPWPIESHKADFIFQRSMNQSIEMGQWPHVLSEMFRILKPGGSIELVEADVLHHNPGPIQTLFYEFLQQDDNNKFDFNFATTIESHLQQAGFSAVEYEVLDIPIGEWNEDRKKIGFLNKEAQRTFMTNYRGYFLKEAGLTPQEYDEYTQKVLEEFEEYESSTRINYWIAHKSLQSSSPSNIATSDIS